MLTKFAIKCTVFFGSDIVHKKNALRQNEDAYPRIVNQYHSVQDFPDFILEILSMHQYKEL